MRVPSRWTNLMATYAQAKAIVIQGLSANTAGEMLRLVNAKDKADHPTALAYFDVVNHRGMWQRARNLLY